MNLRDGEVITGIMRRAGFRLAESAEKADAVIFITCAVRQHAEDKVWSEIGRISKRKAKDEGRKTIIGLVGCMAQEHKEAVFKRSPNVDFVVGPQDIEKIPEIIKQFSVLGFQSSVKGLFKRKIWETDGRGRPEEIYYTRVYNEKDHAYVVISEGCSNFCSYCIVPYVRGPLRHRNLEGILREAELAVGSGRRRITLLGQNVCAYVSNAKSKCQNQNFKNKFEFVNLLRIVNEIDGLKEFSFITSHPKDTTVELFETMQGLDKLKKSLHLPLQSGSDRILKLMNRGYSRKYYLDLAGNYRKIVRDGALTTDIIVGFPGETKKDFEDTVDLVKQVEFDAGFIFKYSPRPLTSALSLTDNVPKTEKERRHTVILDLQRKKKIQND